MMGGVGGLCPQPPKYVHKKNYALNVLWSLTYIYTMYYSVKEGGCTYIMLTYNDLLFSDGGGLYIQYVDI